MLKFQKDYTTTLATFEDLMITTYVIIDDLYQHIKCMVFLCEKKITATFSRNCAAGAALIGQGAPQKTTELLW